MGNQEKDLLIINEFSMLGAPTLYAVNGRVCRLRGSRKDLGGSPPIPTCAGEINAPPKHGRLVG